MLAVAEPAHEQIREARLARGEDVESVARRAGVRPELLRAVEDGRFGDLPPGVYARSAVRACAAALGLPTDEIVAACESMLPEVEDQVAALARLRGVRPAPARPAPAADLAPSVPAPAPAPPAAAVEESIWRTIGAAAVDAAVVAFLTLAAIALTAVACGGAPAAWGRAAAPAFALLGTILAVHYFVLFGGVAGATAGDVICGAKGPAPLPGGNGGRAIVTRALACAAREAQILQRLGARTSGLLLRSSS
jgi:Helix-turn-helix domain